MIIQLISDHNHSGIHHYRIYEYIIGTSGQVFCLMTCMSSVPDHPDSHSPCGSGSIPSVPDQHHRVKIKPSYTLPVDQVQLAAASTWLADLLRERADTGHQIILKIRALERTNLVFYGKFVTPWRVLNSVAKLSPFLAASSLNLLILTPQAPVLQHTV